MFDTQNGGITQFDTHETNENPKKNTQYAKNHKKAKNNLQLKIIFWLFVRTSSSLPSSSSSRSTKCSNTPKMKYFFYDFKFTFFAHKRIQFNWHKWLIFLILSRDHKVAFFVLFSKINNQVVFALKNDLECFFFEVD